MDERYLPEEVRKKFRGRETLTAKTPPRFHFNIERDYLRTVNAYTALAGDTLKKYMPVIKEALKRQEMINNGYRQDAEQKPVYMILGDVMDAMSRDLTKRIKKFDLPKKLTTLGDLLFGMCVTEWRNIVHQTLGIDLREDYFKGEFYAKIVPQWIELNTGLIVTIPQETLGTMKEIIETGFYNGSRSKDIAAELMKTYDLSKSHARFIARDQIAKLNGQINEEQQRDAGCEEYKWRTVGDERVRASHKKLEGRIFNWNNPPIVDEKTGRRCHPMQDYQCRCTAIPVFNIHTLNLERKTVA